MDRDEGPYRPFIVKAIASMETLGGLGELGWGIGLVLLSGLIPKSTLSIAQLGTGGILIYGYSSIGLGVLSFLVALGIWSLRMVGRNIALVAMAIGLFIPIFVAGVLGQLTFVFNLIVYPLVIYYLMREETRKLFK
jgi:uncharacterized membrane protein (DUF2068 family)